MIAFQAHGTGAERAQSVYHGPGIRPPVNIIADKNKFRVACLLRELVQKQVE